MILSMLPRSVVIELNDEAPVTASLTMSLAASKGAVAAITSVARVDEARARSRAVAGRVRSFRRSQPCKLPTAGVSAPEAFAGGIAGASPWGGFRRGRRGARDRGAVK